MWQTSDPNPNPDLRRRGTQSRASVAHRRVRRVHAHRHCEQWRVTTARWGAAAAAWRWCSGDPLGWRCRRHSSHGGRRLSAGAAAVQLELEHVSRGTPAKRRRGRPAKTSVDVRWSLSVNSVLAGFSLLKSSCTLGGAWLSFFVPLSTRYGCKVYASSSVSCVWITLKEGFSHEPKVFLTPPRRYAVTPHPAPILQADSVTRTHIRRGMPASHHSPSPRTAVTSPPLCRRAPSRSAPSRKALLTHSAPHAHRSFTHASRLAPCPLVLLTRPLALTPLAPTTCHHFGALHSTHSHPTRAPRQFSCLTCTTSPRSRRSRR